MLIKLCGNYGNREYSTIIEKRHKHDYLTVDGKYFFLLGKYLEDRVTLENPMFGGTAILCFNAEDDKLIYAEEFYCREEEAFLSRIAELEKMIIGEKKEEEEKMGENRKKKDDSMTLKEVIFGMQMNPDSTFFYMYEGDKETDMKSCKVGEVEATGCMNHKVTQVSAYFACGDFKGMLMKLEKQPDEKVGKLEAVDFVELGLEGTLDYFRDYYNENAETIQSLLVGTHKEFCLACCYLSEGPAWLEKTKKVSYQDRQELIREANLIIREKAPKDFTELYDYYLDEIMEKRLSDELYRMFSCVIVPPNTGKIVKSVISLQYLIGMHFSAENLKTMDMLLHHGLSSRLLDNGFSNEALKEEARAWNHLGKCIITENSDAYGFMRVLALKQNLCNDKDFIC